MRVACIGLGVMGSRMAAHIGQVHELTVFDVDRNRTARFADDSVPIAETSQDAARNAEVVMLSLPSSEIVNNVVLGSQGIIDVMRRGSTVIDTSTTSPELSRELAARLGERGIGFLDAPVSGGEEGAREASLAIMVGGSPEEFERRKELLGVIGSSVIRIGDVGSGEVAKLVNNMVVGAAFAVIAEGFALARECGLDTGALYEAIRGGWAGSKVMDVAAPGINRENYEPGGTVNLLFKDIGYALSLARSNNVPTPITSQVDEIFKAARMRGYGEKAQQVIFKLWEPVDKK